jgi:hypothetical protein
MAADGAVDKPEWRNWQTRWTQNASGAGSLLFSSPSFSPTKHAFHSEKLGFSDESSDSLNAQDIPR